MNANSTAAIAVGLCVLVHARSGLAAPVFVEQWENGVAAWTPQTAAPVVVVTDPAVATHTYQHETTGGAGGRILSTAITPLTGNTKYCMSGWIRADVGTCPYLGIITNNGERWLIGRAGEPDQYGGVVTVATPDGSWHWYSHEFTTDPNETGFQVMDEEYQACPVLTADFDDIEVNLGACAPGPPLAYGDTVFCKDTTPIATLANACVACGGDNGSGASNACPDAANPFCRKDGSCGKCSTAADCSDRPGKICSPTTGGCVATCTSDAQCPDEVCEPATHTCVAASGSADAGPMAASSSSSSSSSSSGTASPPGSDAGTGDVSVASDGSGCQVNVNGAGGSAGLAAVALALAAIARRRRR